MRILVASLLLASSIGYAETPAQEINVPVKPEKKRKKKKEVAKEAKPLPPYLTKGPVHERPSPL